jgi:hypothetical protein
MVDLIGTEIYNETKAILQHPNINDLNNKNTI